MLTKEVLQRTQKPRANFPDAILNYVTAIIPAHIPAAKQKSLVALIWMPSRSSNAVMSLLPCCGVQGHCSMNSTRQSIYCDSNTWTRTEIHMKPQTTFALILTKQMYNDTTLTCSQI